MEEADDEGRDQFRAQAQGVARPVHGRDQQAERVLRGQGRSTQGRDHVDIGSQRVRRVLFPAKRHKRFPQKTSQRDISAAVH